MTSGTMNMSSRMMALLAGVCAIILVLPGGVLTAEDVPGFGTEEDVCPRIVRDALELAAKQCEGTGRNEACYGHTDLEAQPQQEAADSFVFTQAGDIVKVNEMRSLRLGEMNEEAETWGIALLRVQASLPDTSPENVTVILFGDTMITDNAPNMVIVPIRVSAPQRVNARARPNSSATVLMSLEPGTELSANGRLADNSWLRVTLPLTGQTGWMFSDLVESDQDIAALNVVDAKSEAYRPMQVFTLQSGVDDAPCVEAPQSGLIIQTPEGVGNVTFLINEVDIQMDGAVFMQAEQGDQMAIAAIDGAMTVTSGGVSQYVQPGMVVTIPLNSGSGAGVPSMPTPYDPGMVQGLPVSLLPQPVAVAAPYVPPAVIAQPSNPSQPAVPGQPVQPAYPGQPVPTAAPGQPTHVPDTDGDGYPDHLDGCPTYGDQGYGVNAIGCPNPPPTAVPGQPTQPPVPTSPPPPPPTAVPPTVYTVCHDPAGKNPQTRSFTDLVEYNSHIGHGDTPGACP